MEGQGLLTWPDGSSYEGSFVDGRREGKGRYSLLEIDEHQGKVVDEFIYDGIFGREMFEGTIRSFKWEKKVVWRGKLLTSETIKGKHEMKQRSRSRNKSFKLLPIKVED